MAGMYDNVSLSGVLDPVNNAIDDTLKYVGDNPVAHWMQKKFPDATKWDPTAEAGAAIYNARSAAGAGAPSDEGGQDSAGAPALMQGQSNYDTSSTENIINTTRGALSPQEQGFNSIQLAAAQSQDAAQQVADAQQSGANLVPDATQDPVGHLAQRNQNIASGVGGTTGQLNPAVPAAPTKADSQNATLDQTGKEAAAPLNKVTWWKSNSFNQGLLAFGLNLLSGNSLAQSFAVGSQIFDQHYGAEQREAWRDDLIKKGYNEQEVQRYIETGDNKVLTSPQERLYQAQQRQNQLLQQQQSLTKGGLDIAQAQYEQSPEQRAQAARKEQITMDNQIAQTRQMNANADWKSSPEYLEGQQALLKARTENTQARTEQAQANTQKTQNQLAAYQQRTLAGGGTAFTSPMTIGGRNIMINPKTGNPLANSKGQVWVVDPKTNQAMQVAGNPQAAEAANASVQRSLKLINNFDGSGTALFGPTGEMSRSFGDFWGQRSSANFKSRIQTLENSLHSAALAKVEMESNGNAVREGQLKAEVESIGRLTDRNGEPLNISEDRAKEILQGYRDYLGFVGASSNNQLTKSGAQGEMQRMSNQVAAGTTWTAPNGQVWRAKASGDRNDQNIWEIVK